MNENPGQLGQQYPLTDIDQASTTKDRILLEATIMFAQKGFSTVSIRDLAKRVNLKPASLYSHFKNKEALWDEVIEHVKNLYLIYFKRLEKSIQEASSFESVLDCMFVELKSVVNIFTHYGISLIQVEQFRDEKAYDIYNNVFLKYSIDFIKGKFDDCIDKGWVKSFDTKVTATFFMHSVLIGVAIHANNDMKREIPYDPSEMFDSLQRYIFSVTR